MFADMNNSKRMYQIILKKLRDKINKNKRLEDQTLLMKIILIECI
ncbi:18815_t:CDS:2 [Dentiscutata erythropus]|uniref:18815_t:CDS:1 n=1 Tax=Dentiscutata erythropus TaxID=1348616 RepID=A0A9N8YYI4_9GLOM|nr:18815_t:CDS:2 [Dentiscutata erythropus]